MAILLKTRTQEMLHQLRQQSLAWLALVGVLVVMFWIIYLVRTRYRGDEDPMASKHFLLTQMGDLHRQGDLTEEEYRSIKGSLVSDIQKTEEELANDEQSQEEDPSSTGDSSK